MIDAILLIINIENRDPVVSVIPDLDYAQFLFYIGTLNFVIYLVLSKPKELLTLVAFFLFVSLSLSLFFNVRLAKDNYDRIKCLNGISDYFEYFENDCGTKIEEKFNEDVKSGELKYFLKEYNRDKEFEQKLRDIHHIEFISSSCTAFISMTCYNNLVKEYINHIEK